MGMVTKGICLILCIIQCIYSITGPMSLSAYLTFSFFIIYGINSEGFVILHVIMIDPIPGPPKFQIKNYKQGVECDDITSINFLTWVVFGMVYIYSIFFLNYIIVKSAVDTCIRCNCDSRRHV